MKIEPSTSSSETISETSTGAITAPPITIVKIESAAAQIGKSTELSAPDNDEVPLTKLVDSDLIHALHGIYF